MITRVGSISEKNGAFLQPVIKNADTFTPEPALEYYLSDAAPQKDYIHAQAAEDSE